MSGCSDVLYDMDSRKREGALKGDVDDTFPAADPPPKRVTRLETGEGKIHYLHLFVGHQAMQ